APAPHDVRPRASAPCARDVTYTAKGERQCDTRTANALPWCTPTIRTRCCGPATRAPSFVTTKPPTPSTSPGTAGPGCRCAWTPATVSGYCPPTQAPAAPAASMTVPLPVRGCGDGPRTEPDRRPHRRRAHGHRPSTRPGPGTAADAAGAAPHLARRLRRRHRSVHRPAAGPGLGVAGPDSAGPVAGAFLVAGIGRI